jgi:NAD(P)-dependent dehydrogenase (short-subunit alcohol dehydrogenase family)/Tat protein secretion system quality control protein TatD with DNase activity
MPRKKKRGKRRGDSSSDSGEESMPPTASSPSRTDNKKLSFKERRELQREQAQAKRRSKQKCRLCGKPGHIRRECPGIEDGGRGESKYKSKGSATTKPSRKNSKRGAKNRGKRKDEDKSSTFHFSKDFSATTLKITDDAYFPMVDCSTDVAATIAQVCTLSHRDVDSKNEYASLLSLQTCQHFAGVISRCILPASKPSWVRGGPEWLKKIDSRIWFVVGIDDSVAAELIDGIVMDALVDPDVVGLYVALDFKETLSDKNSQIERLKTMCAAAKEHDVPLQVNISGEPRPLPQEMLTLPATRDNNTDNNTDNEDPYLASIKALVTCLLDYPQDSISIHLSSWSGNCENMIKLLKAFPRMMIGLHGGVSFTKATLRHACAFDLPLQRLLLETSSPQFVPSQVSNILGRDAINHGGLLPFVAEAVAVQKTTKNHTVCAIDVARASSENCVLMYPRIRVKLNEILAIEQKKKELLDIATSLTRLTSLTIGESDDLDDLEPSLIAMGGATESKREGEHYAFVSNKKYGLVTGGNRGIGLALMIPLLREDPSLHFFMGTRDLTLGDEAIHSLPASLQRRVTPVLVDVTDTDILEAAFTTVSDTVGSNGLSLLINNAGILGEEIELRDHTLAVNYFGVANSTFTFLPLLLSSSSCQNSNSGNGNGGESSSSSSSSSTASSASSASSACRATIITTSSSCGIRFLAELNSELQNTLLSSELTYSDLTKIIVSLAATPTNDIYSLTNLGRNIFTLIQSRMYAERGIRVVAVSPGFTNTDMCNNYKGDRTPKNVELGASVFFEALYGIGKGKTGIFLKQMSSAGTKLVDAQSVITDWK